MELLCHRGLWRERSEQNTLQAFVTAWAQGWGIETDLRDLDGEIVVSHDPARHGALPLTELLAQHAGLAPHTTLALNVKSDGLAAAVAAELARHGTSGAYVFDMSVPDHLAWLRAGVPAYTRWSDIEPAPVLRDASAGLWLDAFTDDDWWTADDVRAELAAGRHVAVVSPELHGRDPHAVWERLLRTGLHASPRLSICTDMPHAWLELEANASMDQKVAL